MITRRTKIQLLVFVLITLLGVSYVGARYARLDRLFFDDSLHRHGALPRVRRHLRRRRGHLPRRHDRPGRQAELTADGVDVDLEHRQRQDDDPRGHHGAWSATVPRSVSSTSSCSRRRRRALPRGRLGDRQSRTPRSRSRRRDGSATLDALVNSVTKQDLRTVVTELGRAFDGTGEDLGQIIDTSNSFIETANENFDITDQR